jgi:hypothetical protein
MAALPRATRSVRVDGKDASRAARKTTTSRARGGAHALLRTSTCTSPAFTARLVT